MTTPFDEVIAQIKRRGFHNHRQPDHSNIVSLGILKDLQNLCEPLAADLASGKVKHWLNKPAPGARGRQIDLLIGEPRADGSPDPAKLRIGIENKSVITAHRNRDARFDDLNESVQVLHRVKPEAVLVATVIIGLADRVLNVPDRISPFYKNFAKRIRPRLSKGDLKLWAEFPRAISENKPDDPIKTTQKFRQLKIRPAGHTHEIGYDYLLLIPAFVDNVNPPSLPRSNALGIDVNSEYQKMLDQICKAYRVRFHT
ncbi:MAG: hypothetical protein ACREQF_11930 [Candidatus Binataceae bacterium]